MQDTSAVWCVCWALYWLQLLMLRWCVWLWRAVHQARGEMQLAVVIEGLRREGIELAVSPPQVVYK
jgi:hypothetical protein